MFKFLKDRKKKDNKGFTLVELVIVIAILAILVGLLAPQYTKYVEKSRKAADASNMDEMVKVVKVYAADPANELAAGTYTITIYADTTNTKIVSNVAKTEKTLTNTDDLFNEYAVESRFDIKETIFVKRMLQTVLPERLRNTISSNLFEKYVGVSEEQLAYELYMTEEQIRTMKRHGMFIGLHGYDHYWLGKLPKEQMKKDLDKALDTLDEFIDRKRWVMNYPYGSYNQDVLDYIKMKGACVGLTTEVRIADICMDAALELPRLDCNDFPPKSENYKRYDI